MELKVSQQFIQIVCGVCVLHILCADVFKLSQGSKQQQEDDEIIYARSLHHHCIELRWHVFVMICVARYYFNDVY